MSAIAPARAAIPTVDDERTLPAHLVVAQRSPFTGPSTPRGRATAALEGELPAWLRGTLFRVAPMFGAHTAWGPAHWFDAHALAGAIELGEARSLTLRWSLIDSDVARAAASGRVPAAHFASKNQRSFWKRLVQPTPAVNDNTNVNVVTMGSDVVALTESSRQWILDGQDLRAVSHRAYDDTLGEPLMLAHPIIESGVVTNLGIRFGHESEVILFTHPGRERSRRVLGRWKTSELPYIHSFGLTDKTAIVVAHPFTVRPASMLWSNDGFIDHFRWRPERGTRFVLIDRASGATSEVATDAFFTFHVVHSFETEEAITVDLLAYDDANIIGRLSTTALAGALPALAAHLERFVIEKKTRRVERRRLSDVCFEFPYLDFELAGGRSAESVYGATELRDESSNEVVAVATKTGAARRFRDEGTIFGEPVYVGRPGRAREGDGVLLVLGCRERATLLFVLDATTLELLARARFDVPFLLGFHGSFARRVTSSVRPRRGGA